MKTVKVFKDKVLPDWAKTIDDRTAAIGYVPYEEEEKTEKEGDST